MSDEPMPPCPRGCAVRTWTLTAGRPAESEAIRLLTVELEPCGHEFHGVDATHYSTQVREWAHQRQDRTTGEAAGALERTEDVKSEGEDG